MIVTHTAIPHSTRYQGALFLLKESPFTFTKNFKITPIFTKKVDYYRGGITSTRRE